MIWLNGNVVAFGSYPNGETAIDGNQSALANARYNTPDHIDWAYESDQDLIHLMFLKRYRGRTPCHLHVRYMPYSRMDRVEGRSVFTLKYVADFINAMGFATVTVEEPHSDVTCALLDNSHAAYPTIDLLPEVWQRIGLEKDKDYLFFPDAGAQKRYAGITGYKTAVGFKQRDFATGKLTGDMDIVGFDVARNPWSDVLIVDDLCSRGGTFIMAAKQLRQEFARNVYLFVAHCENSMWDGALLDHIDGLYCTDSILDMDRAPQPAKPRSALGAFRITILDKVHIL